MTNVPFISGLGIKLAMTHSEIAEIMTERGEPMSRQAVQRVEISALRKLREHPEIRELAREVVGFPTLD